MHMRALLASGLVCLCVSATSAFGQDAGQVGLGMGYPAPVSLVWHVTDSIAIRPELSLDRTSTSASGSSPVFTVPDTSLWAFGTGVSAAFYISKRDALRTYVAPRFTYTRTSGPGSNADTNLFGLAGLFGAQYAIAKKFSVFGETGLSYSRRSVGSTVEGLDVHLTQVGLRTGAGVIFYF